MVTELKDIKGFFNNLNAKSTFLDFEKTLKAILNSEQIEKLSRIRDIELDNLVNLFYWGVKHTAYLNINTKFYYPKLKFNDLIVSDMLEYILIHLSMRLSLIGESRREIENILTSMVKVEIDKITGNKEKQIETK